LPRKDCWQTRDHDECDGRPHCLSLKSHPHLLVKLSLNLRMASFCMAQGLC
jgi:hypothetical protein